MGVTDNEGLVLAMLWERKAYIGGPFMRKSASCFAFGDLQGFFVGCRSFVISPRGQIHLWQQTMEILSLKKRV